MSVGTWRRMGKVGATLVSGEQRPATRRSAPALLEGREPWPYLAIGMVLACWGWALPGHAWAACAAHVDCDDGDACTTDYCAATDCVHLDVCSGASVDSPCESDSHCNDGFACTSGTCSGQAPAGCKTYTVVCTCMGWFECATDPSCLETQCSELLSLGTCSMPPTSCDDANACTSDSCAEPGGCAHAPVADGTSCSDGNACTVSESCAGGTCQGGAPLACSDGKSCTTDSCTSVVDPVNGPVCQQTNTIIGGTCLIGASCYNHGQVNPSNPCQHCDWTTSQTAWTAFSPAELCNNKDDDCDGLIDEDFNLGAPCEGTDGDVCTEEGGWRCASTGGTAYCADGPVGLWLFDQSPAGMALDASGYEHHGIVYNGAWDTEQRAMYFDGATTYIEVPPAPHIASPHAYTIEAWVRPQESPSFWGGVLGQLRTATAYSYTLRLGGMNSPFFFVQSGYGCPTKLFHAHNSATLNLDGSTWHHIAVTMDAAGNQRIYLNGELNQERAACGTNTGGTTTNPIYIGRRADSTSADYYKGWLRDVALFDYPRTVGQILSSYQSGLPDAFFNAERCDYEDNDCDGLIDEGFDTGTACDALDTDACADDWTICAPDGLSAACGIAGPAAYYTFEEAGGSSALDYSGEERAAELLGDAVYSATAAQGGAGLLAGGSGGIELSTTGFSNAELTVSAWVRPAGWSGGAAAAHMLFQTNAVAQTAAWMSIRHASSGSLLVEVSTAITLAVPAAGLLPDGVWTHVAASWSIGRGRLRLFIGGALVGEADDQVWPLAPLPSTARIGRATAATGGWVGFLDAVSIYPRELPAAEVAALASTGVAAAHVNKEICDGADNQCDGQTDETYPTKGNACDTDDDDFCTNGTLSCIANGLGVECATETQLDIVDVCNYVDDDCDGLTDEDYPLLNAPCDGADVDLCVYGFYTCRPDGTGVECVNESPNEVQEACNDADDDCDGLTDEDFPTLGMECDGVDGDFCAYGTFTCRANGSGVECVNEVPEGVVEACNDIDDDCDGLIDEDFTALGTPCDGSDSDFCKNGIFICLLDGSGVECSNEFPSDITETCNGDDDDCDGLTDEDFPALGQSCDGADTDLCENGAFVCTADGSGVMCGTESPANIIEACNGGDDDCDGLTDENFPTLGDACDGADSDACQNGTLTCTPSGSGVECVNEAPANIAESCNGADDDCDGSTDEDFPVGGPCDGPDADLCAHGVYTCAASGSGVECLFELITNIAEACNGVDDDCDGATDEGFSLGQACDGPDSDLCPNGALVCAADGLGVTCGTETASNLQETCNGLDDDCDGTADEGFPNVGAPCDGPDADLCAHGSMVCTGDGTGTTCGPESPSNIAELCNGVDDDCDGLADEDFPLGSPCDGNDSDLCEHGSHECAADGTLGCSAESPSGIAESCNGADDDCDGATDEDFPVGQPCDGSDSDSCANGAWVCRADGSGVECPSESVVDIAESCNGLDDDCDGATDESFPTLGQPCDGADVDLCKNGTFTCNTGGTGVWCINETITNIADICNGLDDDCDSATDELYPTLGLPCDGTDSDFCSNGVYVCHATMTSVTCGPESPANIPETCNGLDDNCDGKVDDAYPELGQPCDGTDSDSCKNGTATCRADGAGTECVNETIQNITDQCNGADEDCDGLTDEDFPQVGAPCDGPDGDFCAGGTYACKADGSGVECLGDSPSNETESCNALDDDCDGLTDEDFPQVGSSCDDGDGDLCAEGTYVCTSDGLGQQCQGDGPIAYYTFVDQTGSIAYDESGWGNDATLEDGASWWQSGSNKAIQFDGSDDYLVAPHASHLSQGYTTSVEAWIYLDTLPPAAWGYYGIVAKGNRPRNYSLYVMSSGALHFSTGYPYCGSATAANKIPTGQWTHVAVVNAKGATQTHRHYINGVEVASSMTASAGGACNFPIAANTKDLLIGRTEEDNRWFDGRISMVAIWSRALTAAEIAAHAAAPWDPVLSNRELCEGYDNDCDGQTDEGYLFTAKQVGESCDGVGACGIGVVECGSLFTSRCSTNPGGSDAENEPEVCDLLDNDCDASTDEDFPYTPFGGGMVRYPGQTCTSPGQCGPGIVECTTPLLSKCSTEPGATNDQSEPEICDGTDNDCDGTVDELQSWQGIPLGGACPGVGACGPGIVECSATGAATCSTLPDGSVDASAAEVCDGVDNDCDGNTDEDFSLQGQPIGGACVGEGVCGSGIVECNGLAAAICSTNPGGSQDLSGPEVCNGEDDDCDGYFDEDDSGFILLEPCYTGPEGTAGVGTCQEGLRACFFSFYAGWSPCFGDVLPAASDLVCNGTDEDCDGSTDEEYVPFACGTGSCASLSACVAGAVQPCAPGPPAPGDTLCDGVDADCDGQTDEDYVPIPCGLGVCAAMSSCMLGVESPCVPLPPEGPDVDCDTIDENCDGTADEGFTDGVFCTIDVCLDGEEVIVPEDLLCDDGNPCTDDVCTAISAADGGCELTPDDTNIPPDDGFACTLDYCEDGVEYHPILANECLIDDLCLMPGGYDPTDGCAVCYPPHSQTEWSDTLLETSFPSPALEGFTVEVLSGTLTWQTSTKRFVTHSLSAYFGDPDTASYDTGEAVRARLWTPSRPLGPDALHLFKFKLWLETEQFTANQDVDVLRLVARTTNPAAPGDPAVDVVLWDSSSALGGSTHGSWEDVVVDMSALAGLTCQLAFEFDSGDSVFNDFEGAYVDDVHWVTACCFENADCEDDDACTIDVCDSSSGKSLCNYTNTCGDACVPTLTSVVVLIDRTSTMADALGGGLGTSKWLSAAAALGSAVEDHASDLNFGVAVFPADDLADPCLSASTAVDVGFHATATQVQEHLIGLSPSAPQTGIAAGLQTAHSALNAGGYGSPRAVVLVTDLASGESSCGDDAATAAALAADGIDVHVVGIGDDLAISALNDIAFAGGRARAKDSLGAHFYRADTFGNLMWALLHVLDTAAAEHCDGTDNDCDGAIDEGVTPRSCNPTCSGGGLQSCSAGTWGTCSAVAKTELCNKKDDDCDGITDEEWASGSHGQPLGNLCTNGQGGCTALGTYVCNAFDPFADTVCSAVPGTKTTEACNGIDDDCDGLTDENLSKLCNTQCGGGLQLCTGGAWGGCSIPGAAAETCNALDDDCDGLTDEGDDGAPLELACANDCFQGIQQCFQGVWMSCNAPEPGIEECNALDDDCDGLTDEGLDGGALTEVCSGTIVDAGAQGICQLAARACGLVTPGTWGNCDTVATPTDETCNALDDDCDGLTDEDSLGAALTEPCWTGDATNGTPGVGSCAFGTQTCVAGTYGGCSGEVFAGAETCDGQDNDCDGQQDENPGTICAAIPGCHTGQCKCAKKADGTYGCFLD